MKYLSLLIILLAFTSCGKSKVTAPELPGEKTFYELGPGEKKQIIIDSVDDKAVLESVGIEVETQFDRTKDLPAQWAEVDKTCPEGCGHISYKDNPEYNGKFKESSNIVLLFKSKTIEFELENITNTRLTFRTRVQRPTE